MTSSFRQTYIQAYNKLKENHKPRFYKNKLLGIKL